MRTGAFTTKRMRTNRGQVMMLALLLFVVISMSAVLGLANPVVRRIGRMTATTHSSASYYLSESLVEDVAYRLMTGKPVSPTESLTLDGQSASASVTDVAGEKVITSTGTSSGAVRKVQTVLSNGAGAAFFYGIQTGEGGFVMENNSSVRGNVYSNGPVEGTGSSMIYGDVVSAGPSGLLDGVHATGTAHSHSILDSTIEKDAYYDSIVSTIVGGTQYPGSADLPETPLPISDEKIDEWKAAAESGGVTNCTGTLTINSAATVGPRKYTCNLEFRGNFTVTLKGPIWATGNVTSVLNPTFRVDSSLGQSGVVIIADNPSNRITSSKITLNNGGTFFGTGSTTSYIMFVSQNESAETGGSEVAIDISNSIAGKVLVYASHGEIVLRNSVSLKEVTAFRTRLVNSASATYESGLASLLFSSGPSGGYEVKSWDEVAD